MKSDPRYSPRVQRVRAAAFWLVVVGGPLCILSPVVRGLLYRVPAVALLAPLAWAIFIAGGITFLVAVRLERMELLRRSSGDAAGGRG